MGRRDYSAEFGRKVLDLLEQGRSVASVAHDLGFSDQTITWRRQDRIDRGQMPGLNTTEKAELAKGRTTASPSSRPNSRSAVQT